MVGKKGKTAYQSAVDVIEDGGVCPNGLQQRKPFSRVSNGGCATW
jgi:hypothetical protein